ncbi:MAG: CDP-diacylglycerol--serine O-phosphatidyltransferase [Pseudomonadota bacterium]
MKLGRALLALPTLFTLSSVFLGFLAITFVMDGEFRLAAIAILFAGLFDALDGKVARLTRTESKFGIQIDSLADVMSFGLAPAVLIYGAALQELRLGAIDIGLLVAFLFVAAGAIRLARFNIMAESVSGPVKRFIGLPIPMAAGTIASLILAVSHSGGTVPAGPMVALVILLSLLMVSNFTYRKSPAASRTGALLVLSPVATIVVVLLVTRPAYGFFGFFVYYLTFGLVETAVLRLRHRRRGTEEIHDSVDD